MEQAVSEVMSSFSLPIAFGLLQNENPMEFTQALQKPLALLRLRLELGRTRHPEAGVLSFLRHLVSSPPSGRLALPTFCWFFSIGPRCDAFCERHLFYPKLTSIIEI